MDYTNTSTLYIFRFGVITNLNQRLDWLNGIDIDDILGQNSHRVANIKVYFSSPNSLFYSIKSK